MNDLPHVLKEYERLLAKVRLRPEYYQEVIKAFEGNGRAAVHWLITPAKALGNMPPIECEYSDVCNVLMAIEHGVYL